MARTNVERICRLTPLQDGMYFEALRTEGTDEVIYQVRLDLTGPLRPELMREAWHAVVRRHPILRTSFHHQGVDEPVQVARLRVDVPWTEHDWRDTGASPERLATLLAADRAVPFAMTRPPLLRLMVVRLTDDRAVLVWTFHHLLLDGWSTYLVLDDALRF